MMISYHDFSNTQNPCINGLLVEKLSLVFIGGIKTPIELIALK
jgi:hypothetical protein